MHNPLTIKEARLLNDTRLEASRLAFERQCRASRAWGALLRDSCNTYGDHGALISGCGRDHFPEHVKDALRLLAREASGNSGYDAKPKGIRFTTIRALACAVATRDGSGHYGPRGRI